MNKWPNHYVSPRVSADPRLAYLLFVLFISYVCMGFFLVQLPIQEVNILLFFLSRSFVSRHRHHPAVPLPPLKGPSMADVIQPP